MPQTQKNKKRNLRQMSIWQQPKPRGCPANPTQLHPLVQTFNCLKNLGLMPFASYEEWITDRDKSKPKAVISFLEIENLEKLKVKSLKNYAKKS